MRRGRYGRYLRALSVVSDFAVLNAVALLYGFLSSAGHVGDWWVWLAINIVFAVISTFFIASHGARIVYADRSLLRAFKTSVGECLGCAAFFYFLRENGHGPEWLLHFCLLLFPAFSLWWFVVDHLLKMVHRRGYNIRHVVIVGSADEGLRVLRQLRRDRGYGYRVAAWFGAGSDTLPDGIRSLSAESAADYVEQNRPDAVYVCQSGLQLANLDLLMEIAVERGIELVSVPMQPGSDLMQFEGCEVGSLSAQRLAPSPLANPVGRFAKRALDLAISLPVCALFPLIWFPVALAIKATSEGPVFFRQRRTGLYGEEFTCLKFRTMYVNTACDTAQASVNDPRKTRVGAFLRRSSIDELPQFFNVLAGQMSVVGPRPHMLSITEEYKPLIEKYMARHSVKPGITGWAQVNGQRGATEELWQMQKRVELDMWYIRNWNIFLDFKIVVMTIINALRGEDNAY